MVQPSFAKYNAGISTIIAKIHSLCMILYWIQKKDNNAMWPIGNAGISTIIAKIHSLCMILYWIQKKDNNAMWPIGKKHYLQAN